MHILAIDPGTTQSALVEYTKQGVVEYIAGIVDCNSKILTMIQTWQALDLRLVIEGVSSYGMPVGREVFETCYWIGRYIQAWNDKHAEQYHTRLIYRRDVKLHLCDTVRATDANIRQVLLDRYGKPGTKKLPGRTYGFKRDMWSALALATTYADCGDAIAVKLLTEKK